MYDEIHEGLSGDKLKIQVTGRPLNCMLFETNFELPIIETIDIDLTPLVFTDCIKKRPPGKNTQCCI